jgi:RNA-dependent RNA polymerase
MLDKLASVQPQPAKVWSLIDPLPSAHATADLQGLEGGNGNFVLPFEVRYQLEVCISRNILNDYNLTEQFVKRLSELASKDRTKAQSILEYVAEQDERIFDPMTIFEDKEALAYSPRAEIPHYCAYSRKATITPTTIYFSSPTVETTNRVLRHYARENEDGRFLRVQFTDELSEVR